MMQLHSFIVDDLEGVPSVNIRLAGLNILIGKNGSGKSRLLRTLREFTDTPSANHRNGARLSGAQDPLVGTRYRSLAARSNNEAMAFFELGSFLKNESTKSGGRAGWLTVQAINMSFDALLGGEGFRNVKLNLEERLDLLSELTDEMCDSRSAYLEVLLRSGQHPVPNVNRLGLYSILLERPYLVASFGLKSSTIYGHISYEQLVACLGVDNVKQTIGSLETDLLGHDDSGRWHACFHPSTDDLNRSPALTRTNGADYLIALMPGPDGDALSNLLPQATYLDESSRFTDNQVETWVERIASNLLFHADDMGRGVGGRADWLVPLWEPSRYAIGKASEQYLVNRVMRQAYRLLEREVNRFLPSFISSEYHFAIEELPVWKWVEGSRIQCKMMLSTEWHRNLRLRDVADGVEPASSDHEAQMAEFLGARGEFLIRPNSISWSAESSGAGISRWLSATLDLVGSALADASVDLTDINNRISTERSKEVDDWDDVDWGEVRVQMCEKDESFAQMLEPDLNFEGRILIVDEPEANLHPGGVGDVSRWLQDMTARAATTILATHSPVIFDTDMPTAKRHILNDGRLTPVNGGTSSLGPWATQMGLTPGDLYLYVKRFLFVEGEVDRVILNTWFHRILVRNGVRCVSLRGAANANHIMQLDVIAGLGKDVSILLDKTTPDGRGQNEYELRQLWDSGTFRRDLRAGDKLTSKVADTGTIMLGMVEHDQYDMYMQLDFNLVRNIHPRLSESPLMSWEQAWADFTGEQLNRTYRRGNLSIAAFKDFMDAEYAVRFDVQTASQIATTQLLENLVPSKFAALMDDICSPFFGERLLAN